MYLKPAGDPKTRCFNLSITQMYRNVSKQIQLHISHNKFFLFSYLGLFLLSYVYQNDTIDDRSPNVYHPVWVPEFRGIVPMLTLTDRGSRP